jgi:hypothetical protein
MVLPEDSLCDIGAFQHNAIVPTISPPEAVKPTASSVLSR